MPKFNIRVTQVLRVEKEIILTDVEADTLEAAIESVSCGEIALPSDPSRWTVTHSTLQNEEVQPE